MKTLNSPPGVSNEIGYDDKDVSNVDISSYGYKYHQILKRDIAILGKLWMNGMRIIIVGANDGVPVVYAASKKDEAPKKPPPMKYEELPLDKSPHSEYKQHETDKKICENYQKKTVHEYMLPIVRQNRIATDKMLRKVGTEVKTFADKRYDEVGTNAAKLKKTMRDDKNLEARQATVASGALAGLLLANSWKKGKPTKLAYSTYGALLGGALCFPEQTDSIVRDVSFKIEKAVLAMYSAYSKKLYGCRGSVGCIKDKPEPTKNPPKDQCKDRKKK